MRAGEGLEGGTHVAGRLFPRPAAATGGASQTKHVGTGSEVGFGLANLSTIVEGIIVQMQMHVFMNLPQVQSAVRSRLTLELLSANSCGCSAGPQLLYTPPSYLPETVVASITSLTDRDMESYLSIFRLV